MSTRLALVACILWTVFCFVQAEEQSGKPPASEVQAVTPPEDGAAPASDVLPLSLETFDEKIQVVKGRQTWFIKL